MRNVWIFALGFIFVLSGLAFMGIGNLQGKLVETVNDDRDGDTWEISGNYKQGEIMIVEYRADTSWYGPFFDTTDEFGNIGFKTLLINVTNPVGGQTIFTVYLSPTSGKLGQKAQPYDPLAVLKIFVEPGMPNDGLYVYSNITIDEVRGRVKYDGMHKVTLLPPYPDPQPTEENPTPVLKPPPYLAVRREIVVYPTSFLLPVGGGVSVVGIAFSAWAMRKPKHRIRSQKPTRMSSRA